MSGDLLYPSERVLWTGASLRRFRRIQTSVGTLLFLVVWCGIAGSFMVSAILSQSWFTLVFGAAFLLVGLSTASRPILKSFGQARYTVTDQRVIVEFRGAMSSAYLAQLPPPLLAKAKGDGSGSVVFGAASEDGQGIELWAIPDALAVRDLIAGAQAKRHG